jgi:hypothetical protein
MRVSRRNDVTPQVIGQSVLGRPIELLGAGDFSSDHTLNNTLLIGGTHGDEDATIYLLRRWLAATVSDGIAGSVAVLPVGNPDGFARRTRYNERGIDLNRNFGHHWRADSKEPPGPTPWSEPETLALRDFILLWQPAKVVSLHWALAELDADGPHSTALAEAMWAALDEKQREPYRLRITAADRTQFAATDVECPGSLGQWLGYGLVYPDGTRPAMVTLELPPAPIGERWRTDPDGYLAAVEGGVFAMLSAACRFEIV